MLALALTLALGATGPTEPTAARSPRYSASLDVGGPLAIGILLRTYGTFLELQSAVSKRFSLIAELTYLHSENFRELNGTFPGLRLRLWIFCMGAAFWLFRPFSGPFLSVRIEGWIANAHNAALVTASGTAFDVNFQPGWQFDFGGFTLIASVSVAYVTGPIKSADGSVTFPLQGFSATPHVRLGWVW